MQAWIDLFSTGGCVMESPLRKSRFVPDVAGVGVLVEPSTSGARPRSMERARLRGERRAALRLPCTVFVTDEITGGQRCLNGHTVNFSVGGLAVMVGYALAEGAAVEVLLSSANGALRSVNGTVIHCRRVMTGSYEIGINAV